MVIFCIVLLGIVSLGMLIFSIGLRGEPEGGGALLFSVITGIVLWLVIEHMVYREGEPTSVDKGSISVMHDDNVIILRIGDEFQKTYDKKDEYDAIICDEYELMKVIKYDITGEQCDTGYELKFNEDE